jgi:hypothetical protein
MDIEREPHMDTKKLALFLSVSVAAACAASGTQPHDMSQAEHEQAAASEESQAQEHAAQYDAGATEAKRTCPPKGACWTSELNPTSEHLEMAQAHKKAATEHRAAAAALAEAEAKACAGLPESERDVSPFAHREDIASVTPLEDAKPVGKGKTVKTVGATVKFKAVPGLTQEWLQRLVNCHIARAASVGHNMPEMSYCPLVPKGVTANVVSAGDGFNVEIRSEDPASAAEVSKRAQSLVAR